MAPTFQTNPLPSLRDREMSNDTWIDLSSLTLPELEGLSRDVETEISVQRLNQKRWRRAVQGKVLHERAPRYRNPANSAETWSGRGPEPEWVKEARRSGRSLDSLRF